MGKNTQKEAFSQIKATRGAGKALRRARLRLRIVGIAALILLALVIALVIALVRRGPGSKPSPETESQITEITTTKAEPAIVIDPTTEVTTTTTVEATTVATTETTTTTTTAAATEAETVTTTETTTTTTTENNTGGSTGIQDSGQENNRNTSAPYDAWNLENFAQKWMIDEFSSVTENKDEDPQTENGEGNDAFTGYGSGDSGNDA